MALSQACIALKQYGKTAKELLALRDMFLTVMGDIPIRSITKALFVHLNTSDEIPTPRQLREIIHPPEPVWKPDWPAYIALRKRINEGYFPLTDEREYLRDCDNYSYEKRGKDMENYNDACAQVQTHTLGLEYNGI